MSRETVYGRPYYIEQDFPAVNFHAFQGEDPLIFEYPRRKINPDGTLEPVQAYCYRAIGSIEERLTLSTLEELKWQSQFLSLLEEVRSTRAALFVEESREAKVLYMNARSAFPLINAHLIDNDDDFVAIEINREIPVDTISAESWDGQPAELKKITFIINKQQLLLNQLKLKRMQVYAEEMEARKRLYNEVRHNLRFSSLFSDPKNPDKQVIVDVYGFSCNLTYRYFSHLFMKLIAPDSCADVMPVLATYDDFAIVTSPAKEGEVKIIAPAILGLVSETKPECMMSIGFSSLATENSMFFELLKNALPRILMGFAFFQQPFCDQENIFLTPNNGGILLRCYMLDMQCMVGDLAAYDKNALSFLDGLLPNGNKSAFFAALSKDEIYRKNIALSFLGIVTLPQAIPGVFQSQFIQFKIYQRVRSFFQLGLQSPMLNACLSELKASDIVTYFAGYFERVSQLFPGVDIEVCRRNFFEQYLYILFSIMHRQLQKISNDLSQSIAEKLSVQGVSLTIAESSFAFALVHTIQHSFRSIDFATLDWQTVMTLLQQLQKIQLSISDYSIPANTQLMALISLSLSACVTYSEMKEISLETVELEEDQSNFYAFLSHWFSNDEIVGDTFLQKQIILGIFEWLKQKNHLTEETNSAIKKVIEEGSSVGYLMLFLCELHKKNATAKPIIEEIITHCVAFIWQVFFLKGVWARRSASPAFTPLRKEELLLLCERVLTDCSSSKKALELHYIAQFQRLNLVVKNNNWLAGSDPMMRVALFDYAISRQTEFDPNVLEKLHQALGAELDPMLGASTTTGRALALASESASSLVSGATTITSGAIAVASELLMQQGFFGKPDDETTVGELKAESRPASQSGFGVVMSAALNGAAGLLVRRGIFGERAALISSEQQQAISELRPATQSRVGAAISATLNWFGK